MAKVSEIIIQKLPEMRKRVVHAGTAFKSVAVTAASGAALTAHQYMTTSAHVEDIFTPAGLVKLKHNFVYGGVLSLIGLFVPSPVKSAAEVQLTVIK